jgi:DNA-binding transcriptional MerR regulator/arsenate reductase-like glutaredoxin family protein
MRTLPDININPTSGKVGAGGLKSGSSKGNDIFQSIMDSLNGKSNDSNWVSKLYSDKSTKGSFNSGLKSKFNNINTINSSGNKLNKNLHNPEDLIVPASLQNQLVAFLEKQGFSLKDINQVLSSSKNGNGLIQLDKLLEGLSATDSAEYQAGNKKGLMHVAKFKESFSSFLYSQGISPEIFGTFFSSLQNKNTVLAGKINDLLTGDQKDSSFIETSRIPGVQEILFKMGFGVGDVKKIIEMSKNGKGELELEKLSAGLNKFLPGSISESDLVSLFSKNNISVNERLFNTNNSKENKSNLLTDSVKQKELKQSIVTMLKEKGVEQENIKTLLEKLDTAFIKMNLERGSVPEESDPKNQKTLSILNGEKQIISGVLGDSLKQDIAAFLKDRGSSDKDVKSFLNTFGIDIKKADIGQGDNYLKSSLLNEKVFGFLKNDNFQSKADQGSLKLNLTEMIKLAEQKANAAQLVKTAEGNTRSTATLKNVASAKDGSEFLMKETPDVSNLNISNESEIKNIGKVNKTNTASNLPQPLPRIVDKMIIMVRTGEYRSRLKITPPDLGKLDIDITVKNGNIHANLSTENAVVKEIIEANLNQLKQQLNNHGLTVEKFEVMVGLDNGKREENNTWAERRNGRGSRRNTKSKSDNSGEILLSSSIKKNLIRDGQIDVHV